MSLTKACYHRLSRSPEILDIRACIPLLPHVHIDMCIYACTDPGNANRMQWEMSSEHFKHSNLI